jgi:hypothetical protein
MPKITEATELNSKNVAVYNNFKKQYNIFEEIIKYYGVTGDVAGQIAFMLNSEKFSDILGANTSILKNIVSISEISQSDNNDKLSKSFNLIVRNRNKFFLSGNNTSSSSKNDSDTNMITRLLIIYINAAIRNFSEEQLFNDNNSTLINIIDSFLGNLKINISNFMRKFEYEIEQDKDNKLIKIRLFEEPNILLDKIEITLNELNN